MPNFYLLYLLIVTIATGTFFLYNYSGIIYNHNKEEPTQ